MDKSEMPVGMLKEEHQVILRVIRALETLTDRWEQTGVFSVAPLAKGVEFIRLFADACHHGKEEDLLFPILESRGIPRDGGPIGVMLQEHQMARGLTKEMAAALPAAGDGDASARSRFARAARDYIALLNQHIFKEDNFLFAMGDQVMRPEDQAALSSHFCSVNCRAFEGRSRETLQRLANEIESESR